MVALTHALVRRGRLAPFSWWPRFVRRASDPLLHRVERRVAVAGQNPQDAPLWLLGAVSVAGLIAITLTRWVYGTALAMEGLRGAGARAWVSLAVAAVA